MRVQSNDGGGLKSSTSRGEAELREGGQGADELVHSFLADSSSTAISAAALQEFFNQNRHDGMGNVEFGEPKDINERDLKDFRSWIRHATPDWPVHVY